MTVTVSLQDNGGILNGGVDTSTQTFSITITGVDDPPFAVNDPVGRGGGSPRPPSGPRNDNANNPDQGEVLTIVGATRPAGASTIRTGGHSLKYDRPQASMEATGSPNDQRSRRTHASATVLLSVPVDRYKPVVTAPAAGITNTRPSAREPSRSASPGPDPISAQGWLRYVLYRSTNGGRWTSVALASAHSRSITQTLAVGAHYRYRVKAIDKVGNVGTFAYGATFSVGLTQGHRQAQ